MKYGDVLGRSFKALGNGGLWAYGASALAVVAAPFVLVWATITVSGAPRMIGQALELGAEETQVVGGFAVLYATLLLGGLLAVVPLLIARGGLIHAANAAIAHEPVSVGACWSFGLRSLGRTMGIELGLGLMYLLAIVVAEIPFFIFVAMGAASGSEDNMAAFIGSMCFGYLFLFFAIIAIVVVYAGVEALAIRYGLIGGRTFGDAISSGWKAFRAAWKRVVVFGLIMVALAYAWQMLTSVITTPFLFLAMPFSELIKDNPDPAALGSFFDGFIWVYAAMIVLYAPFTLFNAVAWTAFFRQLTGLDAVASPPAPTVTPAPPAPDEQPVGSDGQPAAAAPGFPAAPPAPPYSAPQPAVAPSPPAEHDSDA